MRTSWLLALTGLLVGCTDMKDQPRYEPMEASSFFADGRSARPLVDGTVARGHLYGDDHFHRGREGDGFAADIPFPVTRKVLDRGRERYDIFCSPCHATTGYGDGMVVRRGYKVPPSFHTDRLREAPPGYLFDVISNGFGEMAGYASQVRHEDRWAIVSYLRALQLSQHTPAASLSEAQRTALDADPSAPVERGNDGDGH